MEKEEKMEEEEKDPEPKRYCSSFMLFSNDVRANVIKKNPSKSSSACRS